VHFRNKTYGDHRQKGINLNTDVSMMGDLGLVFWPWVTVKEQCGSLSEDGRPAFSDAQKCIMQGLLNLNAACALP
jgi:hypothetical protein